MSTYTRDIRHETHAASQKVATVTTSAADLDALLTIPDWATGVRMFVGSESDIIYTTDGETPLFETAGAPVGNGAPVSVLGRESVLALAVVAKTASVKVTFEFLG